MAVKVIPIRVVQDQQSDADPLIVQASFVRLYGELQTIFALFESGVALSCERRNIAREIYADALETGLARLRCDLEERLFR